VAKSIKIENASDEIWQDRNAFERRQSRSVGDYNMIVFMIEDVYLSDIILIDTITEFVSTYLQIYQYGMLLLAAMIVCVTLFISICIIRTIVVSPILELTKVI